LLHGDVLFRECGQRPSAALSKGAMGFGTSVGAKSRRLGEGSRAGAGGPLHASVLFYRGFCCIGVLILVQNLYLLKWGTQQLAECAKRAPILAPTTRQLGQMTAASPTVLVYVTPPPGHTPPPRVVWVPVPSPAIPAPAPPPPAPPRPCPSPAKLIPLDVVFSVDTARSGSDTTAGLQPLTRDSSLQLIPRERLRLIGEAVPSDAKICIGFGSVQRKKDYLLESIANMLGDSPGMNPLTEEERRDIVLLVHLADFDAGWVSRITQQLKAGYSPLIAEGRLHAIHAPQELYPKLDVCPPLCSYNDDPHRVKWRSKQNVDYAFLMHYAVPLAKYYIQIEDDLSFAANWVSRMTNYLDKSYPEGWRAPVVNTPWRLIDFSQLGFIGKMVQANELSRMAQFLLLFYDQMPCDLLLGQWMMSMTQGKRIDYWKTNPSLFQHVGMFRTLGGFQPLQERKFGKLVFDNPRGTVHSNMTQIPTYEGRFAYSVGGDPDQRNDVCGEGSDKPKNGAKKRCWFWAKTVTKGDHITIVFSPHIILSAAFVEFGVAGHDKDIMINGALAVAGPATPSQLAHSNFTMDNGCGNFTDIIQGRKEKMLYWEEGVTEPKTSPVRPVKCLRLYVKVTQPEWLSVFQFLVRSSDGAARR